ncbi:DEHA2D14300p [Debaryomyces hansenii CBS767]|uniref:DEHA2D14300p n=1 Tax=Debaryomyces hansenii (strain ATCC 36239 / CBS 767 / BCRC 21394 / JCM 1990 / NBRC 0083 / IGC 2968) TaxID=284592 RepID=Q6BRS0_DEBHA|nr:DEHA2D14300p [Debaryomyces hansenii CBS767]CAG87268.1 DEHA2D14300p [Debaryomyces hansenii CBS767]|eukprot:XP_459100.1 DEHA2D14300p [Debaryomyces hansenii CBS767]
MSTSMHTQYNYNRRNSSATPYTIPIKHQHQSSGSGQTQGQSIPNSGHQVHTGGPVSSSVPSLSREFVVRRISEGETGRLKEELKCEACGKGYKHISSLAKHLWEHTPEWNVTKKLLISKHQQVQLLEAASILVGMNESQTPSRRNSVFPDDNQADDPKYPSPFSPSNSADTNVTSNTSTPPMHPDSNKPGHGSTVRFNFPQPQFKNSFDLNSNEYYDGPGNNNFNRSHSISHYPPISEQQTIKSPSLAGGYLDTHNETSSTPSSRINGRSNSIIPPVGKDDLRSPTLAAKNKNASTLTPSPALHLNNNDDLDDLDKQSNESYEEESVIGKME